MSLAVLHSRAGNGVEAPLVTVEVHLARGLPALSIVSAACLLLVQIACVRRGLPLIYAISGTGTAVLLATIIAYMFTSQTGTYFNDVGAAILGLLYVWFLGGFFFIGLRHLPGGFWAVFMTIAALKINDSIAYGIGRKFGRHKLIPRISPMVSSKLINTTTSFGGTICTNWGLLST